MALDLAQTHEGSLINVGDADGRLVRSDNVLSFVQREDGKVDVYASDYVASEGNVVRAEGEQAESPEQARIQELESQLAALRGGPTSAAPAPANAITGPGQPVSDVSAQNEQSGTPTANPPSPAYPVASQESATGTSEDAQTPRVNPDPQAEPVPANAPSGPIANPPSNPNPEAVSRSNQ